MKKKGKNLGCGVCTIGLESNSAAGLPSRCPDVQILSPESQLLSPKTFSPHLIDACISTHHQALEALGKILGQFLQPIATTDGPLTPGTGLCRRGHVE